MSLGRVAVDGKQFRVGADRFRFAGVTYGTFAARADGELYPDAAQVRADLVAMAAAGFTVVRTYTVPPADVVDAARDAGLRILAGVFWPDWRYLTSTSRAEQRGVARAARAAVRDAAERLAGCEVILALSLGNEVPADVIRWLGAGTVEATLASLADVVRSVDPDLLVTYANYPTAEYLDLPTLDFVTFNVFLESPQSLSRYLTRLHNIAGDRPLVLGELGLDSEGTPGGAARQADVLDWQLATAMERGVAGTCAFSWTDDWVVDGRPVAGWHFGLTDARRRPRPALDVVGRWNRRRLADLDVDWPAMSAVICAYNAADTIDECLAHTCALDYPDLDVVVVDDGSTDATAAIASRHPRARVVTVDHGGLGAARNAGIDAARGDVIAFLDSDAYPSPEWPYYLALGFNGRNVGAAGGPNVPPPDDPAGAHAVAAAPGGPVHVLTADDRAEHVPGCNMAFWRYALDRVGGFDPVFTAAGDDVDVCWKVLDAGLEIGFHPAALVWHHRRPTIGAYLRQQRGYGRSEALVESRHPDRYTALGTARWHGRIYGPAARRRGRQRIYRGPFGTAAYQSVYGQGGYGIDVAYQLGAPVAVAAAVLALPALALTWPALWPAALPGLSGGGFLALLLGYGMVRADPPRRGQGSRTAFRATVALLHVTQPLVRLWGRHHRNRPSPPPAATAAAPPGPLRLLGRRHAVLPATVPRSELAAAVVAGLRAHGLRVLPPDPWDDVDATAVASSLVVAELVTSDHPPGYQQLRLRPRLRRRRAAAWAAATATAAALAWPLAVACAAGGLAALARGGWRATHVAWRAVTAGRPGGPAAVRRPAHRAGAPAPAGAGPSPRTGPVPGPRRPAPDRHPAPAVPTGDPHLVDGRA
ncbi:MAG TPA: glycosyltransferase [Acidimicrobiales bacterium]|nr:glycosyltransferase [Acidimicrobiales bacterium]